MVVEFGMVCIGLAGLPFLEQLSLFLISVSLQVRVRRSGEECALRNSRLSHPLLFCDISNNIIKAAVWNDSLTNHKK